MRNRFRSENCFPEALEWICPTCRTPLDRLSRTLHCQSCLRRFEIDDGVIDFLQGASYDRYAPGSPLSDEQRLGLQLEEAGARRRIENYFLPRLDELRADRSVGRSFRVLDCGCGNGIGVDTLNEKGFDAWGTDASRLRKEQWKGRRMPERLFVADALGLPVTDGFFDSVIASGVLEHIGVVEERSPGYRVRALPERDIRRVRFLSELLRVTARAGTIWLDFPNGAFPIDVWHGERPGSVRWHWPSEGFLPRIGEIRRMLRGIDPSCRLTVDTPHRRLAIEQVGLHRYGRAVRPLARLFLRATAIPQLRFLAATVFNPYLVIRIEKS